MQGYDWSEDIDLSGFEKAAEVKQRAPLEDKSRAVDLNRIREALGSITKPGTKALVQNMLAGLALVDPPATRKKGDPPRYIAWRTVTGCLSAMAEEWEASEALIELLRPSWHAEAEADADGCTPWDVVEGLFESARAGAPAYKAKREAEREAHFEMFRSLIRDRGGKAPTWNAEALDADEEPSQAEQQLALPADDEGEGFAEEDLDEGEGFSEGAEDVAGFDPLQAKALLHAVNQRSGFDWTQYLTMVEDKDGARLAHTYPNLQLILTHDPRWAGAVRKNELTLALEVHGWPFLAPGEAPRAMTDDEDIASARIALELDKEYHLAARWDDLMRALTAAGAAHAYDPLMDYLNGVQWDGTPRIDRLFVDYLGASLVDAEGNDVTGLMQAFGRRFTIALAARGLIPGCKMDTMVHLEGAQGNKKSQALEILGGPFYCAMQGELDNKDSFALTSMRWIIELPELNTFKKAEATLQKSFLSLREDTFRPPYGRFTITTQRRCGFVGTTNEGSYLTDSTGNRRHWVVRVAREIDLEALKRDRDQLWAEAVHYLREADSCTECKATERCEAHRWWLTKDEAAQAERQAEGSAFVDSLDEVIARKMLMTTNRPQMVRVSTIIADWLEDKPTPALQQRVAVALKRLGFERKQLWADGVNMKGWVTPAHLLNAPKYEGGESIDEMLRKMAKGAEQAKA